jgi:hypothetical protein
MRWQPAKPRTRIKITECGPGYWDEQDHRLDFPGAIESIDFRVTGTGHERIERSYHEGCRNGWKIVAFAKRQRELEIAAWLCQHACSFVLFDTKPRATVIGFEREEDAEAFRREFLKVRPTATPD